MRQALSEAESFCADLKMRVKDSQLECQRKDAELLTLKDQLDKSRKAISAAEIQQEKVSTLISRLKSEKETTERVKIELERELETSRAELNSQKLLARPSEDHLKVSFEVEKLLVALNVMLKQVDEDDGRHSRFNGALLIDANESILRRIEACVGSIGEFRNWLREQHRSVIDLKSKVSALESQSADSISLAEDSQLKLKLAIQSTEQRQTEIKDLQEQLHHLINENSRIAAELQRTRDDSARATLAMETENQTVQHLQDTIREKDMETKKFSSAAEDLRLQLESSCHQIDALRNQLRESSQLLKLKDEQLHAAKANNAQLSGALQQLQEGSQLDQTKRRMAEQRLLSYDSTVAALERMRQAALENEETLNRTREQLRTAQEDLHSLDEKFQLLSTENEGNKRRFSSSEKKILSLQKEKDDALMELNDAKSALNEYKIALQDEHSKRVLLEKSLESLRKTEEEQRQMLIRGQTSVAQEASKRLQTIEDETKVLRSTVASLQSTLEISEAQRVAEADARKKLESQNTKLRSQLETAKSESTKLLTNSSSFRAEGRAAKKQIMTAVSIIRELVSVIRADASTMGIEVKYPKGSRGGDAFTEEATQGLSESLGLPDLQLATESLNPLMQWAKEVIKYRRDAILTIRKLEDEKRTGKSPDNEGIVAKYASLVAENDALQAQLTELKRSTNIEKMNKRVLELQSSLAKERAMKEEAVNTLKVTQLQLRNPEETVMNEAAIVQDTALQSEMFKNIEAMRLEVSSINKEATTLRMELKSANHHREVLKDTVEHLEKQLKTTADALAEAKLQNSNYRPDSSEEIESLKRQNIRYKVRAVALDEVVTTYRKGILSLNQDQKRNFLSHEISVLKKGYEEELSHLESEVTELNGRLTQNDNFMRELKRQYEEDLKALYKSKMPTESMTLQLNHLKNDLNAAENRVRDLEVRTFECMFIGYTNDFFVRLS